MALFTTCEKPEGLEELAIIKQSYYKKVLVGSSGDDLYLIGEDYSYKCPMLALISLAGKQHDDDERQEKEEAKLVKPFLEKIDELTKEIEELKKGDANESTD